MAKLYKRHADTINKSKFEIMVEDGYSSVTPAFFKSNKSKWDKFDACGWEDVPGYERPEEVEPFFQPGGYGTSFRTIASMIEMYKDGAEFSIKKPNDAILVVKILEGYFKEVSKYVENLPEDDDRVVFYSEAKAFHKVMVAAKAERLMINRKNLSKIPEPKKSGMTKLMEVFGII